MSKSQYIIPNDLPVMVLDAKTAFEALTDKEKFYAHHLSKASIFGGLIVLLQTSPESPQIYRLIQRINAAEDAASLKAASGLSEDDFKAYLAYCSGIYSNMGNYKGFGDSKFVPNFEVEQFEALIKASKAYAEDKAAIEAIWSTVKESMYSLTEKSKQLGLGSKGITKYFSDNCTQADADLVNKFFTEYKIEGYNNRVIKTEENGKVKYEIRNAGIQTTTLKEIEDFEGAKFIVTSGDYAPLLSLVNQCLKEAQKYVSNDDERKMLTEYVKSFETGSLQAHKDGSRFWIKNKGPTIETYIGFIENYRDPAGMRAEFEGFVAMVNKKQSVKFQELVNQAEKYLSRLPWPKGFEKDQFLRPDFTSLDVLTFSGSGIPVGINIPNYDDIRQKEGFKNVNLGNVLSASFKSDKPTPFLSEEDNKLYKAVAVKSFEVQVGIHELLGHGSGKLLQENLDGTFNFSRELINPETGAKVNKWYKPGETYDSVFSSLGSSYEECRAECIGLYLSCDKEALQIFGHSAAAEGDKNASDVVYINWLSLCVAAIRGLEMYSPSTKEWKQAHSQARFVILQVLLEAGEGFVSVKNVTSAVDGKPDLLLTMDRTKLESVGKPAIGAFLSKLQIYKSTADIKAAKEMYDKYSNVPDEGSHPWGKWRDIVLDRKQPRRVFVQANTSINDEKMKLAVYDPNMEGMIKSWVDRFTEKENKHIDKILEDLYLKDKPHFNSQLK